MSEQSCSNFRMLYEAAKCAEDDFLDWNHAQRREGDIMSMARPNKARLSATVINSITEFLVYHFRNPRIQFNEIQVDSLKQGVENLLVMVNPAALVLIAALIYIKRGEGKPFFRVKSFLEALHYFFAAILVSFKQFDSLMQHNQGLTNDNGYKTFQLMLGDSRMTAEDVCNLIKAFPEAIEYDLYVTMSDMDEFFDSSPFGVAQLRNLADALSSDIPEYHEFIVIDDGEFSIVPEDGLVEALDKIHFDELTLADTLLSMKTTQT